MVPKVKEPKPAREESSDSESSSSAESNREAVQSSDSDSDAESSSARGCDNESVASAKGQSKQSNLISSQARSVRPPQSFKPPLGFKSAKTQSSSQISSTLSDLNGKQVFHITAPAFLPLSKVKEVSLAGALNGEPILKHNGVQFGIPTDSAKQTAASRQTLFAYDSKAQTYQGTVMNVPTYHIQEIISLPGGPEYEETTLRAAKALEKPPRKQPKHLKMRFRPVGSGDAPPETLGSSSEESEAEEPTFKVPKGREKEKERKRKLQQTEADGSQSLGEPRKKSKKHEHVGEEKSKKSKDRDGKRRKKADKAA